ncbi:MAG: hypothetical protein RL199_1615 [Pseudomonadota bacterium]
MSAPARIPPQGGHHGIDFSTTLDERTKAFTVAAAMLGMFLAALDQTIVSTAMPRIAQELSGLDLYTWVTTAYILASTAMVPVYGKLSDIYGRKAILLTGIGLFLAASVACGAAGSMKALVVWRAFQGLGAAALTSTAFAVVADLYEPRKRAKVQGFFGAVFGLSSVIGPILGGVLTEQLSWRSVFYVNVPIGAVAVAFILAKMPALKSGRSASIDFLGALLIVVGSVALMLGLSLDKAAHPWGSPETFGLLALGLVAVALFVVVETKVHDPILPMRLFKNPAFASSALVSFLFGGVFFGVLLFLPLFMSKVKGVSDSANGTTLLPFSLAMSPAAVLGGRLASRVGRIKPLVVACLVVCAAGYGLLSTMDGDTSRFVIGAFLVLLALGIGPNLSLMTIAIQSSVEKRDIGVATSARQFFQQLGGAFGAAILGAVLASTLGAEMQSRMTPIVAQLPAEARAQMDFAKMSRRSFGEGGSGGGQNPLEKVSAGIAAKFDAQAAAVDANPAMDPATKAQAKAGLAAGKAQALEGATRIGAQFGEAVKATFAQAVTHTFVWSVGFTLLTLVAALFLKDVKFGGDHDHGAAPPAEM